MRAGYFKSARLVCWASKDRSCVWSCTNFCSLSFWGSPRLYPIAHSTQSIYATYTWAGACQKVPKTNYELTVYACWNTLLTKLEHHHCGFQKLLYGLSIRWNCIYMITWLRRSRKFVNVIRCTHSEVLHWSSKLDRQTSDDSCHASIQPTQWGKFVCWNNGNMLVLYNGMFKCRKQSQFDCSLEGVLKCSQRLSHYSFKGMFDRDPSMALWYIQVWCYVWAGHCICISTMGIALYFINISIPQCRPVYSWQTESITNEYHLLRVSWGLHNVVLLLWNTESAH